MLQKVEVDTIMKKAICLVMLLALCFSTTAYAIEAHNTISIPHNVITPYDYTYKEYVTRERYYNINSTPAKTMKCSMYLGFEDVDGQPVFAEGILTLISTANGFPTEDQKTCTYGGYITAYVFE